MRITYIMPITQENIEKNCPVGGGGHLWGDRIYKERIDIEYLHLKNKWHDKCSNCGADRFFNTRGYVLIKFKEEIYEKNKELIDF